MYMFWRIDVSTVRNQELGWLARRRFGTTESLRLREITSLWKYHDHGRSGPLKSMTKAFSQKITLTFLKLTMQEDFDGSHIKATQSCVMILCPKPPLGNWKRHFDEVEVFETHCCLRDVGWIRCAGLVDQHDPALVAITLQTGIRLSNPSSVELLVILSQILRAESTSS